MYKSTDRESNPGNSLCRRVQNHYAIRALIKQELTIFKFTYLKRITFYISNNYNYYEKTKTPKNINIYILNNLYSFNLLQQRTNPHSINRFNNRTNLCNNLFQTITKNKIKPNISLLHRINPRIIRIIFLLDILLN